MELVRLSERTYYIRGPVNVGVIVISGNRVALVDSGIDSSYAKRIHKILSDYRYEVACILNTHSHADHCGGNNYFQHECGCRVLASPLETPIIKYPLIQSALLFSGAPTEDLTNRFIMAMPSEAEPFTGDELDIEGEKIKVIDLPGHSINQKGFWFDGTAFVADALFDDMFFKKHFLPFNYDPLVQLETLKSMRGIAAKYFVGGHFLHTNNIQNMIELNERHLKESVDIMMQILKSPKSQERIVKGFLDNFGLKKTGWEYFLFRASVNGYLSALHRKGLVSYKVLDNLAVWYAA